MVAERGKLKGAGQLRGTYSIVPVPYSFIVLSTR